MTEPELILGYPALKHLPPLSARSHQVADQPRHEPSNVAATSLPKALNSCGQSRFLHGLTYFHSFFFSFTRSFQWPTPGIFSVYMLFYPIIAYLEGEKIPTMITVNCLS